MRFNYVLIALVTLAFLATGYSGAESSENDGGAGIDAGSTVSQAIALTSAPGAAVYGNLTSVDTTDWYTRDAADSSVPTCVRGSYSTEHALTMRVASVFGSDLHEVESTTPGARMGIATPGYTGHAIEVRGSAALPPIRPYTFQSAPVDTSGVVSQANDGESGFDATFSRPIGLTGACTLGALQGQDSFDVYTLNGFGGKQVMLSMASSTGQGTLTLARTSGQVLATAPAGSVLTYTLPSTGTYFVTTSASGGSVPFTSYVIGACEPECKPPGHPCNPMCIDALRI